MPAASRLAMAAVWGLGWVERSRAAQGGGALRHRLRVGTNALDVLEGYARRGHQAVANAEDEFCLDAQVVVNHLVIGGDDGSCQGVFYRQYTVCGATVVDGVENAGKTFTRQHIRLRAKMLVNGLVGISAQFSLESDNGIRHRC